MSTGESCCCGNALNSRTDDGSWVTCIHLTLEADVSEADVDGTEDVVSFELVVVLAGDEAGFEAVAVVVVVVVVVLAPVAVAEFGVH